MRGEGKHAVLGVDLDLNWKLYKDVIGDQQQDILDHYFISMRDDDQNNKIIEHNFVNV